MKSKYFFTLTAILIILFSLTTVVANENITSDEVYLADDSLDSVNEDLAVSINENQDTLNDASQSDDVDLSVWIDVENVYEGKDFNKPGFKVPWNVTVNVDEGTARNTKVHVTLSDNMEYVSHNKTMGTYNPATGIWDIGDLTASDNPLLIVLTKLKDGKRYKLTANATTASNDVDLSNNWLNLPISGGSGKSSSNTTETSDDKEGAQHGEHFYSAGDTGLVTRVKEENKDPDSHDTASDDKKGAQYGEHFYSGGDAGSLTRENEENKKSNTGSVSKSSIDVVSQAFDYLTNSISDGSNPTSALKDSNSNKNLPAETIKAIQAYDYTKIPILIFISFLVIFMAIVGYDKVKS